MTSKIKIRIGAIELEYEGSEEFLKQELPDLLEAVVKLHDKSGVVTQNSQPAGQGSGGNSNQNNKPLEMTTAAIATKIGGKSGPELAFAACARLGFIEARDRFSRKEILNEMKNASSFYKKSYNSNLTSILNGLMSADKITEPAKEMYSLTQTSKDTLASNLMRSN